MRRLVAGRGIVCAVLAVGFAAHCAAAQTRPEQGWAHKSGKINLHANDPAAAAYDLNSRLLIQEALARYGIAYDEARIDVLRSLFTGDAVLEVSEGATTLVTERGRDAVLRNFASALAQQADQRRHCITNVVFQEVTETRASVLAYGIVTVAADGLSLGATVVYSADLRREDDGAWRFSRLLIGMDAYSGTKPKVDTERSK